MKGAILTINPHATIVDISHHVPAHSVEDAVYLLKSCYRYFPEGTVHLAVVDPGVGSVRRPLLVKTARYFFVGPDNGLFSSIYNSEDEVEVRVIESSNYRLESIGHTFDGRDIFAPSAAWLTKGEPLSSFGRIIDDPITLPTVEPRRQGDRLVGLIEHVDRFGNLISTLTSHHVQEFRLSIGRQDIIFRIGEHALEGLVQSYSEGPSDRPTVLINSDGRVEVFVNGKSAAQHLRIGVGTEIHLC
jgi:S-adenosylmethionine hydrolase